MEPETASDLMSNNQAVKEFVFFVVNEIKTLNTLDDVEVEDPIMAAVEVKARKLALEKLTNIIKPMMQLTETGAKFSNNEYVT